ncbi:MAG TPA: laccase domain-containing protein, partial [Coriobacteriia bacterium]|nr:laccase domain-containing protein [Coriobacteriia bacterium]
MFHRKETIGPVDVAFTDREGGVSTGPWSSLNLGTGNADDPASVQDNLRLLGEALGVNRIARMTQVHGNDVHIVDSTYA